MAAGEARSGSSPANSIHTFFMKFPIDAAFLDSEGEIVKIVHAIAQLLARDPDRAAGANGGGV